MRLLRGKKIASEILANIKKKIERDESKPGLVVILVGENKSSKLYIKLKARAAKKIGMGFVLFKFKGSAKEKEIIKLIKKLNKDKNTNGIIVQLPLPKKLNTQKIIKTISPNKDADGFNPKNTREFLKGQGKIYPVFPLAIIRLIESARVDLKSKKAVIIANSEIFGKIMSAALKTKINRVEYIISNKIKDSLDIIRNADIVITAIGKPKLIKGIMLKKGAIVIDGGIKKIGKKTLGDVDFNSAVKIAGYLSTVPGGVGPVTVACLLENVYKLATQKKKLYN